jgi:anti-sigma factor RsiW
MDSGPKHDDLLRLNALVDGELAPAERAEIAARLAVDRDLARAYATLARLKAAIAEDADEATAIVLPPAKRPIWRRVAAVAACLAVAAGIAALAARDLLVERDAPIAEGPTAITLASLPAGTTVPRLDIAGLKLVGLAFDPGKVPVFTATYRGPHGCRLDLRAWHAGDTAPPLTGTLRQSWTIDGLTYELVAHGMPLWRFALIAGAAEQQTRLNADPERIDRRLRQANIGAPPCVG